MMTKVSAALLMCGVSILVLLRRCGAVSAKVLASTDLRAARRLVQLVHLAASSGYTVVDHTGDGVNIEALMTKNVSAALTMWSVRDPGALYHLWTDSSTFCAARFMHRWFQGLAPTGL